MLPREGLLFLLFCSWLLKRRLHLHSSGEGEFVQMTTKTTTTTTIMMVMMMKSDSEFLMRRLPGPKVRLMMF